jgi:hypothetical protein
MSTSSPSGSGSAALAGLTYLIAVGIVSLLAVVTLRQDLAGAAGTDNASLILSGARWSPFMTRRSCSAPPSAPPSATGSCSAT